MAGKYLKKKTRSRWTPFVYLFAALIVIGAAGLVISQWQYRAGANSYAELAQNAMVGSSQPEKEIVEIGAEMVGAEENGEMEFPSEPAAFEVDFELLREINSDVVGWLISDGGEINYPVVRGRDNEYYLNHLFNGSYNKNGSLFMDYRNTPGLVDQNTFIYGHNMKNGSMFAPLLQYANQGYYDAHPELWFITPDGTYRLVVFSGYITTGDSPSYQLSYYDDAAYMEYLAQVIAQSDFETQVEVGPEDKIITLSTCAYAFDEARYLVHAKLMKEENAAS